MNIRWLLIFICFQTSLNAQKLSLVNEFSLKAKPIALSIDRSGRLYFGFESGEIERYDTENQLEYNNSTNRRFPITLIEAWQGLKTFIYSASYQEYYFLDRFFNNSEFYPIDRNEFASFEGIATIENDRILWAFNTATQTLKKVDLYNNEVLFDNQLNLTLSIDELLPTHIRAYQNLVFVNDKGHGIAIFDNLGNYLDFISKKGITYFSFLKDEIILYNGQELELINIYKKTKREIPLGDLSFDYVLMENNQLIGIKGTFVQRFEILN